MTRTELTALLAEYRAGLTAEVALLQQLEQVAARQHSLSAEGQYDRLTAQNDRRDILTQTLVAIEQQLASVRAELAGARTEAAALPDYAACVSLRQSASAIVARVLATDQDSIKALADADLARKAALASLERGETTLAAYRKIIAPPLSGATLVDRRG